MINELSMNDFDNAVFKSEKPVLIDFFATWCGPCKMLSPVLEELAEDLKDKAAVYKVDVDKNAGLADRFRILSVPTLMFVKNGKIQTRIEGTRNTDELKDLLLN
ncbi:MAG: thioredoxin [Treponemataceae bacterium]|nr:thioredoxin [Treponemataceae bacterium]